MSLFVETSALVAILLEEEGWQALTARIEADNRPTTCAVCLFEAGYALTREYALSPQEAAQLVNEFVDRAGIAVSGFTVQMTEHAVAGREAFGKGRHPAGLNFGDCLSYGAARYLRAPMLFVGDNFSKTDIAMA